MKKSGPSEAQSSDNIVDINLYKEGVQNLVKEIGCDNAELRSAVDLKTATVRDSFVPAAFFDHFQQADIPGITMIRERVDIWGKTRSMEPKEEIPALRIRPEEIGLIREAPAMRWVKGQEEWDATFKNNAQKAIRQRQTLEAKASKLLERAREQGLVLHSGRSDISQKSHGVQASHVKSTSDQLIDGTIQEDRRWGPFDLDDETPPPSAIAGRRDTVSYLLR